ncbi:hypothetical protein CK203_043067 [Vitis vinifera]|uniref:Uncharacterized protein n=1 Tax=Vitis vinifera TaxID=29760 RepID=A0A438GXD1_VITVI|nr:hypothetical protein CK203_043067 [Vitis vinifera]
MDRFFPSDVKGKKPFIGQRSTDVSAISSSSQRPPRRHQPDISGLALTLPYYATQGIERPPISYTATGQPCYALPLSQALQKLIEAGLLTALAPRPPPQPLPPQFRMDLHWCLSSGLGHETDRCTALRHAIQDLIDQDNHIHMLSWDDIDPEPIELGDIYETSSMSLGPQTPFVLVPDVEEFQAPHSDDPQTPDVQYILRGGRVLRQPPPAAAARPLGEHSGSYFYLEPFSVLQYSSGCTDSSLSQIRVDTTTTPEGLIHMMTAGRATCIVFSDDDLPPEGSGHTRPLYISVGCSGRRVPSVLLDNGSALNVCPLATAIALGTHHPISVHPLRPFELMTAPVLRIPTSFNLLLGRPWIHRAGAIPSSLHQKVKFIHEGQVVVQSAGDMFISAEPVLQISHSDDDYLTGFTFDEHVYLPGMGLGRRQHGPSEFITIPDHDVPFGLGFIPTEADYLYMARLRKERVRARLTHTPFYYPAPYTRSLADYFVRASEQHAIDGIIRGLSTTRRPSFSASSSSYD